MPRRVLQGVVSSNSGDKTIAVTVERRLAHPLYRKTMRRHKKFIAHDEQNSCKEGDLVRIQECRPHSKRKSWEVTYGAASEEKKTKKAAAPKKEAEAKAKKA